MGEAWTEQDPGAEREHRQHERPRERQREMDQAVTESEQAHGHEPHRPQQQSDHRGRLARLRHLVELELHERGQHHDERQHRPQRTPQEERDDPRPDGQPRQRSFQNVVHNATRMVDSRAGPMERMPSFAPDSSTRRSTYAFAFGGRSSMRVMSDVLHIQPSISS